MKKSDLKLIAFDVFGTLAHGNRHPGPYSHIHTHLGVDSRTLSTFAQTQNISVPTLINRLAPNHDETTRRFVAHKIETELAEDLARISLFPETVEVLLALQSRGFQTALVSNLAPPYAVPIVKQLNEHRVLPPIQVWSFDVGAKKPDPRIYEELFIKSGCSPHEVLFIGDKADRDLYPPRTLGCHSRLIARTEDPTYHRAIDRTCESDRIANLRDIFSILELFPSIQAGNLAGRSICQRDV